jgi:hypothetical protein
MTTDGKSTVQTRPGQCPEHGRVDSTRKLPRIAFPFIITGAARLIALTRPYRCPRCGLATSAAS